MKPLFDLNKIELFDGYKSVPFECEWCKLPFYVKIKEIRWDLKNPKHPNRKNGNTFCSRKCKYASFVKKVSCLCGNCEKEIFIVPRIINESKSGFVFCSKSCSVTYNNTHKTTGNRRSKLEIWLEEQITLAFPNLHVLYNNKETINSELDIYFPDLKLAIELNGIFHYEPIYGKNKLTSIKNNDHRKFQACLEYKIELVIIDTSSLKYFKPQNAEKYLQIIKNIIDNKLSDSIGI